MPALDALELVLSGSKSGSVQSTWERSSLVNTVFYYSLVHSMFHRVSLSNFYTLTYYQGKYSHCQTGA